MVELPLWRYEVPQLQGGHGFHDARGAYERARRHRHLRPVSGILVRQLREFEAGTRFGNHSQKIYRTETAGVQTRLLAVDAMSPLRCSATLHL